MNGAIRLLPLADDQIRQYLSDADAPALWPGINSDQETLALARTPLLLRLLTVADAETTSGSWQRLRSASERSARLFEIYVERALADTGHEPRSFPTSRTVHWLSWLARAMKDHSETELLIEHLQPTWLESARPRMFYRAGVCAVVAVAFFLVVQLGLQVFDRLPRGAVGTAFLRVLESTPAGRVWRQQDSTVIALMGLAAGLIVARRRDIKPIETLVWSWDKGWHGMVQGLRRTSVDGLNYVAYGGAVIGLVGGLVMQRSVWNAAALSPDLAQFRVGGNIFAAGTQLLLAAAILRTLRPRVWLTGVDMASRGSRADAVVSGLALAAGASLNLGPVIGVLGGVGLGVLLRYSGGTRLLSASRFADALVMGTVGGFGTGVLIWTTQSVKNGFFDAVGVWTLDGFGLAATAALGVGIAGGFRTRGISPTRTLDECVRKTKRSFLIGAIIAAACGLAVTAARYTGGMPLVRGIGVASVSLGASWGLGLAFMIWVGVVAGAVGLLSGAFLGALFGVLEGLTGPDVERRTTPNQGIHQSARNMAVFALIGALLVGVPYGLFNLGTAVAIMRVGPSASDWINLVAGPSVLFGLLGALVPGAACVQHYTLRCVLWCFGLAPWQYAQFLNYATERMLLQRVGGRYRFIHDLLREHVALMERATGFQDRP